MINVLALLALRPRAPPDVADCSNTPKSSPARGAGGSVGDLSRTGGLSPLISEEASNLHTAAAGGRDMAPLRNGWVKSEL